MNEPDGMDYYVMGTVISLAEADKTPFGTIKGIIVSYAVARDLNPAKLAAVAMNYPERIRRIKQARTARELIGEAEKHFPGER